MQLLDFGSAALKKSVVKDLHVDKVGRTGYTYATTSEWYDENDINTYCKEMEKDKSVVSVLDLTAAVKVLCYLACNRKDGFRFCSNTSQGRYDGIESMLLDIWCRATDEDFAKRYVNCQDLIKDIDLMIESIEGRIRNPEALRLVSKNTLINVVGLFCYDKFISDLKREHYKEFCEDDKSGIIRINQLIKDINVSFLPNIKVENVEYRYHRDRSPLENYLVKSSRETRNLLLLGDGGGGKGTALKCLYLKSLFYPKGKSVYLYLSGSDFGAMPILPGENKIIAALNYRYFNCNIRGLVQNPKIKLTILFDALDKIPSEIEGDIYQEINELSSEYGNQFIMTSCNNSCVQAGLADVIQAELVPLDADRIRELVPTIRKDKDKELIELLKYPMMMSIFLKIQNDENAKKIRYPEELIDAYLSKVYKAKNGNVNGEMFLNSKLLIAKKCICKIESGNELAEAKGIVKSNQIEHIIRFNEYTELKKDNGCIDNNAKKYYKADFQHKKYEDFFKGLWLYDFLSNAIKNKDSFKVEDFHFENLVKLEKDLSPYWIDQIKILLINQYLKHQKTNKKADESNVYLAINQFISRFEKSDVVKKSKDSFKNEKHQIALKNIIKLIVLCCNGSLADVNHNKPLVNLGCFTRAFFELVDYENVNSAFIPW